MKIFQHLVTTIILGLTFATVASAQPKAELASAQSEIPNVGFCELVKNPSRYFDKTVRVKATLVLATEAAYLRDDQCPLSHDDQVGVKYVVGPQGRDSLNAQIRRMRTSEFGSKARVTVLGILLNTSRRSFAWYRYQFDVERIEELAPVIVRFEKTLERGTTYRATVRGDRSAGMVLATPLSTQAHFAVRFEWSNLKEFPSLKKLDAKMEKQIVFTVTGDDIKQMTELRWNRTLTLKIISVESQY